jgi:hypothetical protein
VTLKNGVFWDITLCGSCCNRHFGGTYHLNRQLPVMADVPSLLILSTLIMEVIRSSETSILTRATWRNIPEDGILHSHLQENLTSDTNNMNYFFLLTPAMLLKTFSFC